jgi:hypothetical protein
MISVAWQQVSVGKHRCVVLVDVQVSDRRAQAVKHQLNIDGPTKRI